MTEGPDVLYSESSGNSGGGRDGTAKSRPSSPGLKTDGLDGWEHWPTSRVVCRFFGEEKGKRINAARGHVAKCGIYAPSYGGRMAMARVMSLAITQLTS